jgi:hypothetical protein
VAHVLRHRTYTDSQHHAAVESARERN